jgi:predicted ABC-type ATPase
VKKFSTLATVALASLFATGCYSTKEGRNKIGVPFSKDTIESRYERSASQLFAAAKETLAFNGTLTGENTIALTLAAKVDERTVWVKVTEIEPTISQIQVQARKRMGGGDVYLASELDKQIALRLK